jgi:hypothetical protein
MECLWEIEGILRNTVMAIKRELFNSGRNRRTMKETRRKENKL